MSELNYYDVEELYTFLLNKKLEDIIAEVKDSYEQVLLDDPEYNDGKIPEYKELKEEAKELMHKKDCLGYCIFDDYEVYSYIQEDVFIDEDRIKDRINELNEDEYNKVLLYLGNKNNIMFINYIKDIRNSV